MTIHTDLEYIARVAADKDEENDHFRQYLKRLDGSAIDHAVHEIYAQVNAAVSCTDCGNCCNHLVVNITPDEIKGLSDFLQQPEIEVREKYIEESMQGACYINTIPCHFFAHKKCTIYTQRFTECRDFPHLHKPGFRERLLGTLLHYPACPIIFNVVEQAKTALGFIETA
jgi:hypothetical protein